MPETLQLGDGHTGADPARVDELFVRREIAEQQRPDAMSAALGIGPSNYDKFFAVETLTLSQVRRFGS